MTNPAPPTVNRWPHRWAVLLVWAVFPLIWVGGLVTTYRAGMAVYDWPTTFGYQPLGYPLGTWIFGPYDIFVEHGHRLLGVCAGLTTIGLAAAIWMSPAERPLRRWAIVAVVGICLQGALGGMRVLLDRRQLAMIHGCVGPAFFAFAVVLSAVTSPGWKSASSTAHAAAPSLQAAAVVLLGLVYLQMILGAQVRHVQVTTTPDVFRATVLGHLVLAGVTSIYAALFAARVWLQHRLTAKLPWWTLALCGLLVGQLALGVLTWQVKFGWIFYEPAHAEPIVQNSMLQALTITAHVAVGSLILACAAAITAWSFRLFAAPAASGGAARAIEGSAAT